MGGGKVGEGRVVLLCVHVLTNDVDSRKYICYIPRRSLVGSEIVSFQGNIFRQILN